jgi:hypothetical protein
MVLRNYYRVMRLALDALDRDGVRTASRKIDKKIILKGGIKYESCGKFKWNQFRFTN